jgi:hypothetical protein
MTRIRWAALLASAAFLARWTAFLGTAIFGTDGGHYLLMADWMRGGRFHEALLVGYHPLYPLLIAASRSFLGSTEAAGGLVSVVLGAAATIPLFLMVHAVFGRPAAFLTSLMYAFSPTLVAVQSEVMTEGTFIFFLFSSMWLTWRMMEAPSLPRGVVLGAAAAAAFLTRPEGLLAIAFAVGWPIVELLRRRDRLPVRVGGTVLTLLVVVLLLSPYLLWAKSVRGKWVLSVRPSAISVEWAVGYSKAPSRDAEEALKGQRYATYLKSMYRLTLSGALIPFYVLGLASLRRVNVGKGLFYASFPVGLLGGILLAIGTHGFISIRYLLAGMTLMSVVAALGIVAVIRWAVSRWPEAAWPPIASAALVLIVAVVPGFDCFKTRRTECVSYREAARVILAQGWRPHGMSGPVEQVAYLTGCRSYYGSLTHEEVRAQIKANDVDGYVYSEKDVVNRRSYVEMLRSCDALQPPMEIVGPPGTLKVYVHRAK